jgi:zinc transport system ATP-binding protein
MSNVLISVRDLSVAYEGTTALDEVSLDIFEDDFLGVIGPNGGGKTSLVRAILGNIPYRGTVNYAAELFRGKERLIGYLPQQNVFDRAFPISVTETVLSGLQGHKRFRSRYTAEDRQRFEAYLDAQLKKVQLPNPDWAFLRERILTMYANPAINQLSVI